MLDILHSLSSSALRSLASSLREGSLSSGVTAHAVQQIAGPSLSPQLLDVLESLSHAGWSFTQMADLATAVADARDHIPQPELQFDLVLSGPEVDGIPTLDTAAVMHTLIEQAQHEVILVGYAIYNGKKLFKRLSEKIAENPDLKVWFCINIQRQYKDTSLSTEIVHRFAHEFATKHWPWNPKPAVYYDPRSLEPKGPTGSSLHAKCLLIDRKLGLITSANYTEAAQKRNIEAGVVVRYRPFVERLATYFDALRREGLAEVKFLGHDQGS